jgi:4-azaleucine resistance transporter AzlC
MKQSVTKIALTDSAPALFGYLPLGIAFGIVSFKSIENVWVGPLMSLFVYAGAAQYMSLSVIASKGTLWDLSLMTFILNFRHVFYGIPFLKIFKQTHWKKSYLIFGITDETYSILTTSKHKNDPDYCFWISALTHSYWVLGTIIGSILGVYLSIDLSALDFTLTALFVILSIEQAYVVLDYKPFFVGTLSFFAAFCVPDEYFLSACMSLCIISFLFMFIFNKGTFYARA